MAKLPDFVDMAKKLDFQGLLDSVKSAVSGGPPPKAPEGDEVAARFVEIITLTHSLATAHAEQAKVIASIHSKLNALYKDMQLLKEAKTVTDTSVKKETVVETKVLDSTPVEPKPSNQEENK